MPHLSQGMNVSSLLRRVLVAVLSSGLILAVVGARWFTRVEVDGDSMQPGLSPGDRLLVRRTDRVRPGQVVVLRDPRDGRSLWIKRVHDVADGGVDVRGDAPHRSTDSRQVGLVPRDHLVGRVVRRYAAGP